MGSLKKDLVGVAKVLGKRKLHKARKELTHKLEHKAWNATKEKFHPKKVQQPLYRNIK